MSYIFSIKEIKRSKNLEKYHMEFHGTRDYYSINKYISENLSLRENDPNQIEEIIEKEKT